MKVNEREVLRRAIRDAAKEIVAELKNDDSPEVWLQDCIEEVMFDTIAEVFDLESEEIFW